MKQESIRSVYVETTIASYCVSRLSRDAVIAYRQKLTRQWWSAQRQGYRTVVSAVVIDEAGRGDARLAGERLKLLGDIEMLVPDPAIEPLARMLKAALDIPDAKEADAFHLAYAVHYNIDCFLTWNCTHFASAHTERVLANIVRDKNLWLPIICTPENMLQEGETQ